MAFSICLLFITALKGHTGEYLMSILLICASIFSARYIRGIAEKSMFDILTERQRVIDHQLRIDHKTEARRRGEFPPWGED